MYAAVYHVVLEEVDLWSIITSKQSIVKDDYHSKRLWLPSLAGKLDVQQLQSKTVANLNRVDKHPQRQQIQPKLEPRLEFNNMPKNLYNN